MTRRPEAAMTSLSRGCHRLLTDCPFRVLSAPNEPTASPPSNPKRSDRLQRFVCPVWVIFRIFLLHVWCSMLCLRLPSRGVIVRWSWIWPVLRWGPPSRQVTPNKQTNCHSKPEPRRTSTSQVPLPLYSLTSSLSISISTCTCSVVTGQQAELPLMSVQ